MNAFNLAGMRRQLSGSRHAGARAQRGLAARYPLRQGHPGLNAAAGVVAGAHGCRPATAGWALIFPPHECAAGATNNKTQKEKGNRVKPLNPSIQRLEERIAPGGLTLPGLSLPTLDLGGGGGECEGAGGGTSANDSHRSEERRVGE